VKNPHPRPRAGSLRNPDSKPAGPRSSRVFGAAGGAFGGPEKPLSVRIELLSAFLAGWAAARSGTRVGEADRQALDKPATKPAPQRFLTKVPRMCLPQQTCPERDVRAARRFPGPTPMRVARMSDLSDLPL